MSQLGAGIADSLWRFGTQSSVSFRGLFMWFTPFPYISNMFIAPFVQIGLFALVTQSATGVRATDGTIVGLAVLSLSWIVYGGILQSFTYERDFGTLAVLFVSKGNRLAAYWSRGALHYLDGLLAASVTLVVAVVVFQVDVQQINVATVAIALLSCSAACVSFALFCGNFTLIFRNWLILVSVVNSATLALTGVVIPRDSLPSLLASIGNMLPLTHALTALRSGLHGITPVVASTELGWELVVATGYALAGSLLYRWIEYRARVRGEFHE